MTNQQADKLIGKTITVKHNISDNKWTIKLIRRWHGTIYVVESNVFGIEQTTQVPLFNVYPVQLES